MRDRRRGFLRVLAVVLTAAAFASGGPAGRVDAWSAPENRECLKIAWWGKGLVAGSPAPGWPFLLYVVGVETKASQKVERELFGDTEFVLASNLCHFVRITPSEAVDLPYLKQLTRIQAPMIVVVGRDLAVRSALADRKITLAACRDLVTKAVDESYEITLRSYVDARLSHLDEAERLWRAEEALKADEKGGAVPAEELKRRSGEIAAARKTLAERDQALKAQARLKAGAPADEAGEEPGLSDAERAALRIVRERAQAGGGPADAFVLEALRGFDSGAMAKTLLKLARKDSWHAWQAGRLLAEMDSPGALQALSEALAKGGSRERTVALAAFFDRPAGDALPLVHAACGGDVPVRAAAVRALGAEKDARSGDLLVRALSDPSAGVRAIAARGLGRLGDPGRVEPLRAALLKDEEWCVRKAAAEALGRIRGRESVPPLLDAMAAEGGILRETCHEALLSLSAQTFGFDLARWKEWWSGAAASFEPAASREVDAAREEVAAALRDLAAPVEYHRIRTHSRNVIFLLDIGPSMDAKMDLPPEATAEQRAALWRGSKLDLAKAELVRVLGQLEDEARFNVLAYAGGAHAWRTKPARAAYRAGAIGFVRELKTVQPAVPTAKRGELRGGTLVQRTASGLACRPGEEHQRDVLSALLIAMGLYKGEPLEDDARPPADTIFLVVDGQPTAGEVRDVKRIVEIVREINRGRGVVIHCVAFHEAMRTLYGDLAAATGGTFVVHGR